MSINQDRLRKKKEDMQRRGGGGILRPKEGKNYWRVFLFLHKVKERDFDKKIYDDPKLAKVGSKQTEIDREVAKHFWEGNHANCSLDKKCPVCKDARALLESGSKSDKRAGRMLSARIMHHLNAVDMRNPDDGVQLASLPKTAFEPILDVLMDEEDGGEEAFGLDGIDFIITKDKSKQPSEQYNVRTRDKSKCKRLPKSFLEDVKDLMTMEELDPGHNLDDYDSEFGDDDDEKDEEDVKSGKSVDDNDDDDDGDDDDDKSSKNEDDLVGKTVSFKDGKKTLKGEVVEILDDIVVIDVDGKEWEEEIGKIKVVK